MLGTDPYHDAFRAAAQAARAGIRHDRARAPNALKQVFEVVEHDPTLDATTVCQAAGIGERAMRPVFRGTTGISLSRYLTERRIEAADVLRMVTDLKLAPISERVGYAHYRTFVNSYKRLKGELPSKMAREPLPPPLIDDETSLLAGRGLLDEAATVAHIEDLLKLYPAAAGHIRSGAGGEAEPRILIAGSRDDRLQAEDLWRKIRDLPFEQQCRQVRGYLFASTVFFDLLLEKSRLEGRESRRRGVELAQLALLSLEGADRELGERIHDLRALGWAWLGNAYRLALDFSAAATAFERANREWSTPRAQQDLSVLATLCALKGSLRMVRREYVGARRDLDRACALYRQLGQARNEARELITRASIHGYAGKLGDAIEDLQEAAVLTDETEERELAFAIRADLAKALARAGKTESAAKELARARRLHRAIDDPLGRPKLEWIAGLISEREDDLQAAKELYLDALAGFRGAHEPRYFGVVSVDFMVVYATQYDWGNVKTLAAEALPILGSQQLHKETLVAVKLLAEAVEAGSLSRRLVTDLRAALRQDPLLSL